MNFFYLARAFETPSSPGIRSYFREEPRKFLPHNIDTSSLLALDRIRLQLASDRFTDFFFQVLVSMISHHFTDTVSSPGNENFVRYSVHTAKVKCLENVVNHALSAIFLTPQTVTEKY